MMQGQYARDRLDHAAAGAEIAKKTLRRHDGYVGQPRAKRRGQRCCFLRIAGPCSQGVGVDVADVARRQVRRGQRPASSARQRLLAATFGAA